ncbi:MAG: hypothetical protein PHV99_03770 [Candidatus Pacebacteria bacterium]|nr:hypothetical protein [Candidatus Paceibacterota bacterium]
MTTQRSLKFRELPEREQEIIKRERERSEKEPPLYQSRKGWDA